MTVHIRLKNHGHFHSLSSSSWQNAQSRQDIFDVQKRQVIRQVQRTLYVKELTSAVLGIVVAKVDLEIVQPCSGVFSVRVIQAPS